MQMCDENTYSICSWLVDFYFMEFSEEQSSSLKTIIGCYDMWTICRWIQPSLSMVNFWNLCRKKFQQVEKDSLLDEYNACLNRWGLIDLVDLMGKCRVQLKGKPIPLSMKNVKNDLDRLFYESLLESYPVDHTETELIEHSQNDLKHTLCMYLSALLDRRNGYALIHCLRNGECIEDERSSWRNISIGRIIDQSFDVLKKDDHSIKECFDFLDQLQIIINENEHSPVESNIIFRQLLQLIVKQLQMNLPSDTYQTIIEEFCQCFQTTISQMNSSIQSASSQATLMNDRLLRAVSYVCAKQIIDLPVLMEKNDCVQESFAISSPPVNDQIVEEKTMDQSDKSRCTSNSKTIRKYRSLDLSIIHETSFESDCVIEKEIDLHSKPIVKRQPLQQIDVNSFDSEERQVEYEKVRSQNSTMISLISDGDKENLPMITKKRSIWSTKAEPPNKKHKTTNLPSADRIPSFQSPN